MGTHCEIKVVQDTGSGKLVYVVLYIHYDGYLSGVGKQLATLLYNVTSKDAQPNEQREVRRISDCGELAAVIVHHFKSASPFGNCYIVPTAGENRVHYTYTVLVTDQDVRVSVRGDEPLLKKGTVKQFLELCMGD